jgi:hypothetical protein
MVKTGELEIETSSGTIEKVSQALTTLTMQS